MLIVVHYVYVGSLHCYGYFCVYLKFFIIKRFCKFLKTIASPHLYSHHTNPSQKQQQQPPDWSTCFHLCSPYSTFRKAPGVFFLKCTSYHITPLFQTLPWLPSHSEKGQTPHYTLLPLKHHFLPLSTLSSLPPCSHRLSGSSSNMPKHNLPQGLCTC